MDQQSKINSALTRTVFHYEEDTVNVEKLEDLMFYFQKNEILLYLFLSTCQKIPTRVNRLSNGMPFIAAVSFNVDRFILIYNIDAFAEMTREQIYFVLIHEAFHAFRLHCSMRFRFKGRDHPLLLNVAMDGVINEDILEIKKEREKETHKYLLPDMLESGVLFEEEYRKKTSKDKRTTENYYDWLEEKANSAYKKSKEQLLAPGSYVKDEEGNYGKIIKKKEDGTFEVEKKSLEEIFDEVDGKNKQKGKQGQDQQGQDQQGQESGNYHSNELTPVIPIKSNGSNLKSNLGNTVSGNAEVIMKDIGMVKPSEDEKGQKAESNAEVLLKNLVEEAKNIQKHQKDYSPDGSGNNFFTRIEELYKKSVVNWRAILRRKIDYFMVREKSSRKIQKKSYITWLRNPRSRYGILSKHFIDSNDNFSPYMIVAIDTSGSIFCSDNELRLFFTEIDSISKWLNTMGGKVFTLQWDTEITEEITPYIHGDWKKIREKQKKIIGGGGTDPSCIFKYLEKQFIKHKKHYVFKNKNTVFGERWGKFPLLLVLTDGFFAPMGKSILKLYGLCEDKVIFFTDNTSNIYPKENFIPYKQADL